MLDALVGIRAAAAVLVERLGGEPAADAALLRMRAAARATCAEFNAAVEEFKVDAKDFGRCRCRGVQG